LDLLARSARLLSAEDKNCLLSRAHITEVANRFDSG